MTTNVIHLLPDSAAADAPEQPDAAAVIHFRQRQQRIPALEARLGRIAHERDHAQALAEDQLRRSADVMWEQIAMACSVLDLNDAGTAVAGRHTDRWFTARAAAGKAFARHLEAGDRFVRANDWAAAEAMLAEAQVQKAIDSIAYPAEAGAR